MALMRRIQDASGKTALDFARKPAPAGPGVAPFRADPASRAATVALLEPLVGKPPSRRLKPRPAQPPRRHHARRHAGWRIAVSLLAAAALAGAQSGPQTLVDLIRDGNREAVLAAITSPAVDVNAAAPDGSTPLLWATY